MEKPLVLRGWDMDLKGSYIETGKPPILTLNMTGACNLKCAYCHTDAGERNPNEMSIEDYKSVIDQAINLGVKVVWIGGKGEPTIDPKFREVVEYVNSYDTPLILNTNATMIDEELAKFMHSHKVYPEVKILSLDEAIYDLASGVEGSYSTMRRGLNNLLEAGYGSEIEESGDVRITDIAGMMLLAKPFYDSIPTVLQYCKDHNMMPTISDVVASGRVVKNRNLGELKMLEDQVLKIHKIGSEIMDYPLEVGVKECGIQYGLYVQNTGEILVTREGMSCDVCDYFGGKSMGSVKKVSLGNAWENIKERRRENEAVIRQLNDESKECKTCLGGCAASVRSHKEYEDRYPA